MLSFVSDGVSWRLYASTAAEDIIIADAGDIITATNVEGALQENRTALDLNTTHRTSNGSDHSYIDQDVTETGDVTHDTLTLTGASLLTGDVALDVQDGNIKFANGHGIDFSATSDAAGMTSELFDDYEKGEWTPTYVPATNSFTTITYNSAKEGKYTKIGNTVIVHCSMVTNDLTVGTASGDVTIAGLPYTTGSAYGNRSGYAIYAGAFAGDNPNIVKLTESDTTINIYYQTASNGTWTKLDVSDLQTGTHTGRNAIYFTAVYTV
jgi:hypothetical protein